MPSISDELDGDNDYARLMKCIYGLDLDFDYSVSMIYRTQHIPTFFDYIVEDVSQYDYTSDYQTEYLRDEPIERYLLRDGEFFYKVAYEVQNTEVNVKRDNRYIFIGTFSTKFKRTSYIQDKVYLLDVDICRHFDIDRIYLYTFSGFIKRYGKSELERLGKHINQKDSQRIIVSNYALNREIFTTIFYSVFDRFLYI
jgi:hypothetical protein